MGTVRSTICPDPIQIDRIQDGKARLLCHWNIEPVTVETEDGETHQEYEYDEAVIGWALPSAYASLADVEAYFASIQDEILGYAQGTRTHLVF